MGSSGEKYARLYKCRFFKVKFFILRAIFLNCNRCWKKQSRENIKNGLFSVFSGKLGGGGVVMALIMRSVRLSLMRLWVSVFGKDFLKKLYVFNRYGK